jgi:hypothetical protein
MIQQDTAKRIQLSRSRRKWRWPLQNYTIYIRIDAKPLFYRISYIILVTSFIDIVVNIYI